MARSGPQGSPTSKAWYCEAWTCRKASRASRSGQGTKWLSTKCTEIGSREARYMVQGTTGQANGKRSLQARLEADGEKFRVHARHAAEKWTRARSPLQENQALVRRGMVGKARRGNPRWRGGQCSRRAATCGTCGSGVRDKRRQGRAEEGSACRRGAPELDLSCTPRQREAELARGEPEVRINDCRA